MDAKSPCSDRSHSLNRHRLACFDYADPNHAYFVTICADRGAPFTDARLAHEVEASLEWFRARRSLVLYAYCLMPDHLHLLCQLSGDGRPLGTVIGAFKTFTTRQSWRLGYHGTLWQARFHDHIVRRSEDGEEIARYILANPVRKCLVAEPEAYRWSGMPDSL